MRKREENELEMSSVLCEGIAVGRQDKGRLGPRAALPIP